MEALVRGLRSVARNWGLAVLVLVVNISLALLLALPLAGQLRRDLDRSGASIVMMYGFDHDWWSRWQQRQDGTARTFAPDLFGTGFAYRNVDSLLRGELPARLFARGSRRGDDDEAERGLDPVVLGVGVLYLLAQVFLTGGLLGVFRAPQGGWTFRSLVHGSGFYFARLLRVSLLALVLAWLVFAINAPFARWVDAQAREAVSETTAIALAFSRHALLLFALALVHALASFAKVMVVREERQSAVLALLSSAGFCVRNAGAVLGQYAVVAVVFVLMLALWGGIDARLAVTGWRSQLMLLVLLQLFMLARIALRLGLLAGQLELHRARGR
jgi:hypothetical protein